MRFQALDGWRGVCALLVAIYHLRIFGHFFDVPFVRNSWLFVDFFFVLSGFVVSYAYEGRLGSWPAVANFMIRRFGRLWPLHAVTLMAMIVLAVLKLVTLKIAAMPVQAAAFDGTEQLSALPSHLVLLHIIWPRDALTWNVPSWSISAEFLAYGVLAGIVLCSGRFSAVASALLAGCSALAIALFSDVYLKTEIEFGLLRCFYGFFVGRLVFALWQQGYRPSLGAFSTIAELAVILAVIAFVSIAGHTALSMAAPFVFAAAVWIFSAEAGAISRALRARPFEWLGSHSYSIYMVHWPVFSLFGSAIRVSQKFFGPLTFFYKDDTMMWNVISFGDRWMMDLLAIPFIATTLLLAAITYRYIEKPGQTYFNRLAQRKANA